MQGVAAKTDASCYRSRARASVTGQTTIAPFTAATPMAPPPSETSGLASDLIVILGLPALLLSVGAAVARRIRPSRDVGVGAIRLRELSLRDPGSLCAAPQRFGLYGR
jgi:hypothetical protein